MTDFRVLVVSHYAAPHVGGIEVVVANQLRRLAQRGVAVELLTSDGGAAVGVRRDSGTTIRRVRAWHGLTRRGVPFPVFAPSLLLHAWRAVRKADVVHIHDSLYLSSWVAALLCRLTGTPYVVSVHVGFVHHPSCLVRFVQALVNGTTGALVMSGAAVLLPIDPHVASFLSRFEGRGTALRVLTNAVDVDVFRPARDENEVHELRRSLGVPEDQPLALYVGRFVPKKGFDIVARAAQDDYHLVFVGAHRPPGMDDARMTFLGELSAMDVARAYRACDLFIGASVGEAPLTVREALASGTPVLLEDHPAYRSLGLPDELVAYARMRASGLSGALTACLRSRAELQARGAAGRQIAVEHFSWDAHIDQLLEAYAAARTRDTSPRTWGKSARPLDTEVA